MNNSLPVVGEHWDRSDGSKDGITILSVGEGKDPWIEYRYDSGQKNEKNLFAFHCHFYKRDK